MTTEHEVEAYKEVLDIMAARIKRTEQHNSQLSEAIFECRKRVERLNAELEQCARKSIPALAQAQIDQLVARNAELEKDKARLDWLEENGDQIHCSECWAGNIERYYIAPTRAAIDAEMKAMTPTPLDDFPDNHP
jgi:predicted RNase H-like nuclease (RuvC/YqgF family)